MAIFEDARPACPLPEVCSFSFSDCIKTPFPDGTRLEAMQKVYGTAPVHDPAHKAHPDKPVYGMYVIAMDGTPAETLVDRYAALATGKREGGRGGRRLLCLLMRASWRRINAALAGEDAYAAYEAVPAGLNGTAEIHPKGVTKEKPVAEMAEAMGFSSEDCVAFGGARPEPPTCTSTRCQ